MCKQLTAAANLSGITSYDWVVSTQRNLSDGVVFFSQIRDATDLNNWDGVFASHYFNITSGPTTTAAGSTSPTPTMTSMSWTASAAIATSATPTETATPTATSSGLSLGITIGIGVGTALACALLVATGVTWVLLRRRKEASRGHPVASTNTMNGTVLSYEMLTCSKAGKYPHAPVPAEVERSVEIRYELPA